jgi:PAS domain S-box-containing protein
MGNDEFHFRRLFEAAQDGILILDADTGQLIDANPFLLETLGYSRKELTVKKLWDIGAAVDIRESKAKFALLQQHGYIRYDDLPLKTKDGSLISVEIISSVFTAGGKKTAQCLVRDITDRKREEEKTARRNRDLAERALEMEAANRNLEAFNYMVAHELSQPLALINGYCQAIKMRMGDRLGQECLDYLRGADKGTTRMNHLIETLLDFSGRGNVELCREMVDLSALSCEVAKALDQAEPERQVDFQCAPGMEAPGDANLLRVVLENLLGNAWKYTRIRGRAVIRCGVVESEGVPAYFVSDNGIGFDMACSELLFAPFQRLPGTTKTEGFGIGLATVERIVRQHGGKVWAEGELDKGACIYFTLAAGGLPSGESVQ